MRDFLLIMKRKLLVLVSILAVAVVSARDIRYAFLGDSNTWSGGVGCTQDDSWTYWFMQQFMPASCYNYARSGATWTNTSETLRLPMDSSAVLGPQNVVFNQALRLIRSSQMGQPAPDVILIMAGTNDAWFMAKRPDMWSMTVEEAFAVSEDQLAKMEPNQAVSLASSIRLTCETLRRAFPMADIVLLTPTQTTKAENQTISRISDIIEGCGMILGMPVVRLDGEQYISSKQESRQLTFTKDGVHTNRSGARRIGLKIASLTNKYGVR